MALLTSPTLERLIKEARLFLKQPNAKNSTWSDEELTVYINDAIRQYFVVIEENGEGQFDTTASLNLVAGQDTVALPSDCFEIKALYKVQTNQNVMLRYFNNLTEGYDTDTDSGSETYAPYYYFRGNSLVLRPVPGFSQTGGLYLEYTQFPETLITGGNSLTSGISPIFKELVVMFACYKAKLSESAVQGKNTYGPVERHLADLFQAFKQAVGGRSKAPQYTVPYPDGN